MFNFALFSVIVVLPMALFTWTALKTVKFRGYCALCDKDVTKERGFFDSVSDMRRAGYDKPIIHHRCPECFTMMTFEAISD